VVRIEGDAASAFREERIWVGGRSVRYLTSGEGPPLVLVHALGENTLDWSWVQPALSRGHRVYAPDLPGITDGVAADHSSTFFTSFLAAFLDALRIERAAIVGNSLGGLVCLRLALSEPGRVGALGLVGSAGLGREITPALSLLTLPGSGEEAIALCKTPVGVRQRAWGRAALLFARPWSAPRAWLAEQYRLARTPGFLEATLAALRAQADPAGQREVLLEGLGSLKAPTLIVWGTQDRIFPRRHAEDAAARLHKSRPVYIPDCGHLPHVERPERFAEAFGRFLDEVRSR
jgi:pimeloyl-ACP methyl ester carboxylesterase